MRPFSTALRVRCDASNFVSRLLVVIAAGHVRDREHGWRESTLSRSVLDDLIKRELEQPVPHRRRRTQLDKAIAASMGWRAGETLAVAADYNDMIYAATREEIEARRKAFIRKWRLKHRAVADSLEEAGRRLFTFTRLPPSQWRSARTTNAIERLHEEFKRRIKTQTVLPSADTAAMLFWALLASGQINMRKVDGWQTLSTKLIDQPIDLAA